MSNIFNNNSRFAGLMDKPGYDKTSTSVKLMKKMGWKEGSGLGKNQDGIKAPLEVEKRENNTGVGFKADEKKINTFNSFKDNGFRDRRQNRYPSESERQRIREEYEAEEKARKEHEKQEQERLKQESLKIENFPELVNVKKEVDEPIEQNYIEKLKKVDEVKVDKDADPDLENLKPGWTLIKKDKLTGKIITKSKFQINKEPQIEENVEINILNALVELHQRRTEEYIELYGYDTWEKMFKCPNWREWEAEFEDDSDEEYEDDYDDEDEEEY